MRDGVASRIMARTTLNLDPVVLRELKARGAAEGRSIGDVASDLLAAALTASERAAPAAPAFRWVSTDLGTPMVDLTDPEAVRRVLDAR